ncbi:hypothetical protein [Simonsiella muelleri]|nr:hypothetical protein [Simonsiella muelleri]
MFDKSSHRPSCQKCDFGRFFCVYLFSGCLFEINQENYLTWL